MPLQYELGVDFYFVSIIKHHTDTMIDVLKDQLKVLCKHNSKKSGRALPGKGNIEPKFLVHDLGSNDNRFLETVVKSVKISINLRVETY